MTGFNYPGVPPPQSPISLDALQRWAQAAFVALNRMLLGKLNCTGDVTLASSVTTTTLTDSRITARSFIDLMPQTESAKNAKSTVWISGRGTGTATINHALDITTDRTFTYLIIG